MDCVEVAAGQTYRVATAAEITEAAETLKDKIVTNGNTITINGLDGDLTYNPKEIKAPTGYNLMSPDTVELAPADHLFAHQDIENNKGTQLPSTGGMGTTIFYVIGGILVLAAAIILISKRRVQQ